MGASNGFSYIINAKLQLNKGSLSTVIAQISEMDKDIKNHFGKNNGGVKVPLVADKDITRLQKTSSEIIERYNKGQVPTIKVPIIVDPESINKLQARIAEVKKQLNSLSDDKKSKVDVNTSLVVGRNAGDEIQKQVDEIKPVIKVTVVPDEDSLKDVKAQIEAIRADVQATVNTIQTSPNGDPILGHHRGRRATSSVGNTANGVKNSIRTNPRINPELENQRKSIQSDINTTQGIIKAMQDELKLELSVQQIEKRIQSIRDAREKGAPKVQVRNAKGHFSGSINADQYDNEIKSLEDALKKHEQIEKLQKELTDKEDRLSKLQEQSTQRRFTLNRPKSNRVTSWYDDIPLPRPRLVVEQKRVQEARKLKEKQKQEEKARQQIQKEEAKKQQEQRKQEEKVRQQMSGYVSDIPTAENMAWEQYNSIGRVTDTIKAKTMANTESKYRSQKIMYPQNAWQPAWDEYYARKGWETNPNKAYNQAKTEQQTRNREAERIRSINQTNSDYTNHIRRFGPYNQYSAESMVDALRDPHVSLADSQKILKQLNQQQAMTARANGMNFQKSYSMRWLDDKGQLQEANTMVYQYTKLGEVIEKADKGFLGMMEHITGKVGVFSALEGGIFLVVDALKNSISEMVQFNQQLAEIQSTTQNINNSNLKSFYTPAGGSSQLQSQIQNNAFSIGKQFGVDTLNTVMPIEQSIISRPDLIGSTSNPNTAKYDSGKEQQIAKNIMQFSAISTGGKEDEQTVNELTHDILSLYQANQTVNPKGYMDDMTSMLDYMSSMHSYGVNTTSITNAMSELAPESLKLGINNNQAMALMGTFDLANAGGQPEDTEMVGKTFYNSIMHANTNTNLKDTLSEYLGIDLNANPMSSSDLVDNILKSLPSLKGNDKAMMAVATALSSTGSGSQTKTMLPLMTKFLEGSQTATYKNFMGMSGDNSKGAMNNAWGPYSKTLVTNINSLVQSFKELAQLIGQLGFADTLGAMLKFFTLILNTVDKLLEGMQKLSAFFQDQKFTLGGKTFQAPDPAKFTASALGLMGTLKLIQRFFNKKQWGGYVGSAIAKVNPFGSSLGIKQNPPLITTATSTVSTVAKEAEAIAPSALPFIPINQGPTQKINPQEMNQLERTMASKNVNSVLNDVMTFSTADMMVNDFKANPATARLLTDVNKNVIPKSLSDMNVVNGMPSSQPRNLYQNIARTEAMGTGRRALSSVGSFLGEASMIGYISNGTASSGMSSAFGKMGGVLKGILPMLTDFGFLLTRLTIIGGALFVAFEGVKLVADQIAKDKATQQKQVTDNLTNLQKQAQKDPNVVKNIQSKIQQMQSYAKTGAHQLANNPIEQKYGVPTKQQTQGEANIDYLKQFGIQYHNSLFGNKDYITYKSQDSKGKWQDQTYHIGNTKEQKQFNDFLKNGAVSDTKKIADQWAVNTDYLTGYSNQLKVVNALTQNLTESMRAVDSATKSVDATFAGINSSSALQQKISITQNGLNKASSQYNEVQQNMHTMSDNKDTATNQYNDAKNKVINSGVSNSQVTDMETKILVARANGQDPKSIIDNYNKDPKMQDLATAFNTMQDFITSFNSTSDNFLSLQDQINSMNESLKQWQAQMNVAKLGLDAMNASLSSLTNVANVGKSLVNMTANPLNNGDNSAQIGALSSSMTVSQMQLSNMQEQRSKIQQEMSNLVNNNPNQDFSLNAIYNPSGSVSAQQLEYKSLYETNTQITDSITNQTNSMYDQVTQLRDLVLNSSKYADVWQRVQDNVQLVKDSIKQTGDFSAQIANLNSNALAQTITGTDPWTAKKQQLQNMSSSDINMASQLQNALVSSKGDTAKLTQAMADIQKNEGDQFEQQVINPLKNVVDGSNTSFMSAGNLFTNGAKSFTSAVSDFNNVVTALKNQPPTQAQAPTTPSPNVSSASQPAGGSTSSLGKVTNTGQSFQLGFQERSYNSELTQISRGAFAGNEDAFVQAGAKYGVDPALLMAIAIHETGGKSDILDHTNNVGNIKGNGYQGYQNYPTLEAGVEGLAQLIAKKIGEGYTTLPTMNSAYAEDPNWATGVAQLLAQETGTSTSTWIGQAGPSAGLYIGGPHAFTTAGTPISVPTYTPPATTSAPTTSNGGVPAMFSWYNSILNDTSKMQYVWGGAHQNNEDWNTFIKQAEADCSGLVNQVYHQFMGINLGNPATTTSESMWNSSQGTKVARGNLQAGDLVFFGSGGDASHVGVYAGNNQMYTIDHSGMPVTKENLWSDYMGGKHYNSPASSQPITSSVVQQAIQTQQDTFVQAIDKFISAMNEATAALNPQDTVNSQNYQLKNNLALAYGNGNIADVLGTSGILSSFDVIQQARQGIFAQEVQNKNQIDFQNAQRNQVIGEMQKATNNGDASSYNEYHAQLASIDKYIGALQKNTDALQSLDAQYKAQQQLDPRYNYSTASGDIQGGIATLKLQNAGGQNFTPDYMRVVNEVNTMLSTYDTHIKETQALQTLWNQTGQQTDVFATAKRTSDQDNINLIYAQLDNINQILNKFAQGTQSWYSALETVVSTEQALQQLEQTRLDNAKTNFDLTGTNSSAYIQQQAYMNSLNMSNANKGYHDAMNSYNSGMAGQAGYGIQTSYFKPTAWGSNSAKTIVDYLNNTMGIGAQQYYRPDGNIGIRTTSNDMTLSQAQSVSDTLHSKFGMLTSAYPQSGHMGFQTNLFGNNTFGYVSAQKIASDVSNTFGINAIATHPDSGHFGVQSADQNLSSDMVNQINAYINKKFKVISKGTGSSSNKSDLNQQLAGLQVISDAHNKMIDQMNTYKQAVTDGFKAGALSIDEYMSKLNQLRDKQTETKENAINMISSMQNGFQSALSDALTKGMQGSINSPIDFMNSIKSTISSSVSGQLSQTLLQNTGLQDVMNKITSSITKASTSGDPNAIANMFNNNDFGKQIQNAIAPFLPLIQQIVGSTKGIFTILNNQTFNATSGFKIDNYMNEIATKQTYQGLKTWNNSMTNDVGSPIVNAGSGGAVQTTKPSQTPTGIPTTTTPPVNGSTSKTGVPPNTVGGGTGAPSTSGYTNGSNNGKPFPSAPKAPASTSSHPATSGARTYVVKAGDNPWTIENKLGLPHGWLATHNSINPNDLQIGQVLKYHTGGIAGVMNFQSAERLQANEVSAILQKGEPVFQPKQIGDLFSTAFNAGQQSTTGGATNINITVNIEGGNASDKQGIEQTVKLAVSQALAEFRKQTRLGNLSSRGTSY